MKTIRDLSIERIESLYPELAKTMKSYNADSLDELMDILPDLELDQYLELDEEDGLPQKEEADLAKHSLSYKELAVPTDASCPFSI